VSERFCALSVATLCYPLDVPLLVTVHVLAAVIGIGPTYFFPSLLRPSLPPAELRGALAVGARLARYPQVGGPVAVVSGIALVFMTDTHLFAQKWIVGSMLLFVAIQAVIMTVAVPATKKLAAWTSQPKNASATALSREAEADYRRLRMAHTTAAVLGTMLFGLMILKPL
jgi:uncharacterized membrane protein